MKYQYKVEVWCDGQNVDNIYFASYREAESYVNRNLDFDGIQVFITKNTEN